jgi:hypothetical protein
MASAARSRTVADGSFASRSAIPRPRSSSPSRAAASMARDRTFSSASLSAAVTRLRRASSPVGWVRFRRPSASMAAALTAGSGSSLSCASMSTERGGRSRATVRARAILLPPSGLRSSVANRAGVESTSSRVTAMVMVSRRSGAAPAKYRRRVGTAAGSPSIPVAAAAASRTAGSGSSRNSIMRGTSERIPASAAPRRAASRTAGSGSAKSETKSDCATAARSAPSARAAAARTGGSGSLVRSRSCSNACHPPSSPMRRIAAARTP